MSGLTRAIQACLPPVTADEQGVVRFRVAFPSDFVGFNGHFPGRPVLPGVCLVQTALVALSQIRPVPVVLKRLVSAKWMATVLAGEEIAFEVVPDGPGGQGGLVRVTVRRKNDKVADFSLETGVPAGRPGAG